MNALDIKNLVLPGGLPDGGPPRFPHPPLSWPGGGPIISDCGLRPPISLDGLLIPGLLPPLITRGGPIFSEPGGGPIGDIERDRGRAGACIGGEGGSGAGSLAFKISGVKD